MQIAVRDRAVECLGSIFLLRHFPIPDLWPVLIGAGAAWQAQTQDTLLEAHEGVLRHHPQQAVGSGTPVRDGTL